MRVEHGAGVCLNMMKCYRSADEKLPFSTRSLSEEMKVCCVKAVTIFFLQLSLAFFCSVLRFVPHPALGAVKLRTVEQRLTAIITHIYSLITAFIPINTNHHCRERGGA